MDIGMHGFLQDSTVVTEQFKIQVFRNILFIEAVGDKLGCLQHRNIGGRMYNGINISLVSRHNSYFPAGTVFLFFHRHNTGHSINLIHKLLQVHRNLPYCPFFRGCLDYTRTRDVRQQGITGSFRINRNDVRTDRLRRECKSRFFYTVSARGYSPSQRQYEWLQHAAFSFPE